MKEGKKEGWDAFILDSPQKNGPLYRTLEFINSTCGPLWGMLTTLRSVRTRARQLRTGLLRPQLAVVDWPWPGVYGNEQRTSLLQLDETSTAAHSVEIISMKFIRTKSNPQPQSTALFHGYEQSCAPEDAGPSQKLQSGSAPPHRE